MSTLRVSSINNASASSGGLSIDSSGDVTVSSLDVTSGISGALPSPNRNLLYNGAMQVAQRGTSVTGNTAGGYLTADRWDLGLGSLGTWTQTIENDAPTGSGLRKSWKVLCTTADSSPAASDLMFLIQRLEGQDVQRIAKGTASAKQLTLSFWVKSNVTGTYTVRLADNDNNRNVAATYSVSASATWEKKTITFPADTTGVLDNDNATSLFVAFWLAAGSDYTSGSTPTTWETSVTGDLAAGLGVNLASATNNYWQITGVQLEVGDAATDFEFKSYGQELAECQRYYEKSYSTTTVPGAATGVGYFNGGGISNQVGNLQCSIPMKVTKRSDPTISFWMDNGTSNTWSYGKASANSSGTPTAYLIGDNGFTVYIGVGSNWVASSMGGHWVASAEL